jgi:xanthine dehydrogenase YagT iron-sulfur-binding subunit
MQPPDLTRRTVLATTGLALLPIASGEAAPRPTRFTLNGAEVTIDLDPRTTLLDALRDHFQLAGTKKGCAMGACGVCTVHLDGKRVVSCLVLAGRLDGREVRTIEGIGEPGHPHPVQAAFAAHDALQCGYCTPGQVMSAVALIEEGHDRDEVEIREWMSGNLCRCGAYNNIVDAVQAARKA